ncbi:MAG TPA: hypothetical protein DIV86_02765 [Alphaproteobacteria bacterium]|nr:hypothetical protein [Alphaproteobacteria bacterium]
MSVDDNIKVFVLSSGVVVIETGGTFSAEKYDDIYSPPNTANILSESPLPSVLNELGLGFTEQYDITQVKRQDSKLFSVSDLQIIYEHLKEKIFKNVVIIHGTDALIDNTNLFQHIIDTDHKNNFEPNIVFTGAYIPIANGFDQTDGLNNLKLAIEIAGKKTKEYCSLVLNGKDYDNPKGLEKRPVPNAREEGTLPYEVARVQP